MGALDHGVRGSQSATHDAGNRDEHDVLANVALGHDHRRAQGGPGQIGEGKARQDNVTTREDWRGHTGSPSAAEYMSSPSFFQKSKAPPCSMRRMMPQVGASSSCRSTVIASDRWASSTSRSRSLWESKALSPIHWT